MQKSLKAKHQKERNFQKKRKLKRSLDNLLSDSLYLINRCNSLDELYNIKVLLLGRKGILNLIFKELYDKTM